MKITPHFARLTGRPRIGKRRCVGKICGDSDWAVPDSQHHPLNIKFYQIARSIPLSKRYNFAPENYNLFSASGSHYSLLTLPVSGVCSAWMRFAIVGTDPGDSLNIRELSIFSLSEVGKEK